MYVLVPAVFLVGLLLIPVGLRLEHRRARAGIAAPAWPRIDLNDPAQRHAAHRRRFDIANVAILSVASYGAVGSQRITAVLRQAVTP